ncbi:prolyl 4-hydroxylase subunit alpha-1-like [Paramacrobiotus metropolitanus]|uniref:prolyl 4-hydroxylase subunit alpha-1-like n=1 Tax=Paramacrobiotus metropolitanus TaxID=2943436 RepID=UPI0024457E62|nr:prolyl 4-hydroxylase subunit alpha-1-like [Paramacrobiotus metropolitanus]
MHANQVLIVLCILYSSLRRGSAEVFTAIADLEKLLENERLVVDTLERFLDEEEQRMDQIRKYTTELKNIYATANDNLEKFIAHPVNVYLFVKKLTLDWKQAEDLLNQALGRVYLEDIYGIRSDSNYPIPTDEDLNGVAVALSRLQDTYRIDSEAIAEGRIKGVAKSPSLTALECFELGKVFYNFKDYDHSMEWMRTALHRMNEYFMINETFSRADVLEYLAFSSYLKGELNDAVRFTRDILDVQPSHERAQNNLWHYNQEMALLNSGRKKGDDGNTVATKKQLIEKKSDKWADERRTYEILCRGEKQFKPSVDKHLNCFFTANDPYLFVQPVKSELVHKDPDVIIYHDVISDREIGVIKSLAVPRLQRATVQNAVTGELETAHYRISKSAWLKSTDDPVIDRVNKRIAAITGLDTDYAEELQIANYGIGGHYEPHFDFARKAETKVFTSLGMGNRVATMLFYMSDVEAGGATVFPKLNLALWPKKGSAAFWYNLHKNGEGDVRTRHAACPVLSGVKWVSNKWIHEYGQEWHRPCELEPDGYEPEEMY